MYVRGNRTSEYITGLLDTSTEIRYIGNVSERGGMYPRGGYEYISERRVMSLRGNFFFKNHKEF